MLSFIILSYRFKFACKVEDDTEEALFHMVGQPPQNILDVSAAPLAKEAIKMKIPS